MSKQRGFTIVELLIVIVVIGILAAIGMVSSTNIRSRADSSVAKTDLAQAAKKISLYFVEQEAYPASLADAGIADTTHLRYTHDNSSSPKTFCITATVNNAQVFADNSIATPTDGHCQKHRPNPVLGGLIAEITQPTNYLVPNVPRVGTVIFTGIYRDIPTINSGGWQQTIASRRNDNTDIVYAYKKPDGWTATASAIRTFEDNVATVVFNNTEESPKNLGIGRHSNVVNQYDWLSPMHAVLYNRTLSESERNQVIAWLKDQL